MGIKYDGIEFENVEQLIQYKKSINEKINVINIQEKENPSQDLESSIQNTEIIPKEIKDVIIYTIRNKTYLEESYKKLKGTEITKQQLNSIKGYFYRAKLTYNKLGVKFNPKKYQFTSEAMKEIQKIKRELPSTIPKNYKYKVACNSYFKRKQPIFLYKKNYGNIISNENNVKMPYLSMIYNGNNAIFIHMLKRIIKDNSLTINYENEGKYLDINNWNEFLAEFLLKSKEYSLYLNVPDRFKIVNNTLKYESLK